jgi:DNA helicase HerA-like ATPase
MVVSQRPSEVSSTIFAQCNNFISLRLTNSDDQAYIQHLIPNNASTITDILPNLAQGECIVVGDAILMPAIVKMPMPNPQPQSADVKVYKEWQEDWRDIIFEQVVKRWQKEAVE